MTSLLSPVFKLSRENTQLENVFDIAFKKAKDCGGTVNRTSVYAEAAVRRVLCYEKYVPEFLFLIKLNPVDLYLH